MAFIVSGILILMVSRKNIILLASLVSMVILGMLSIGLGLILAFVVHTDWLYLSLTGIALIVIAIGIVVFEIKRVKRIFKK